MVFVLAAVQSLEAEAVMEAVLDSDVAEEAAEQLVVLQREALSRIYLPIQT